MGEIPHGSSLPATPSCPAYDYRAVSDNSTSYAGESAGTQARCGTNPPRRILVVDGEMGLRQSSAEVLIRCETNCLVENCKTS